MFKRSLLFRITFTFLVILIVVIIGINYVYYGYIKNSLVKEAIIRANATIVRISENLSLPIWNFDDKQVKKIIDEELNDKNIAAIYVNVGSVFPGSKNGFIGKIKIDNDFIIYDGSTNYNIYLAKTFYKTNANIYMNDGDNKTFIGQVFIYLTDEYLNRQIMEMMIGGGRIIIFSLVLFMVFIFIYIKRILIDPLIILNRTVSEFGKKNLKIRSKIKSEDEIGNLARSFNKMADSLEEFTNHLEDLVNERTEELNQTNEELRATVEELNETNAKLSDTNKKLQVANEQIGRELQMAQKIQQSLIPKIFPDSGLIRLSGTYIPMEDLGGDYYDVFNLSDSKIGFVIADVSGHGVPSALITTMAKVSFSVNSKKYLTTGEVMNKVNEEFCETIGELYNYLTAFYGIIDLSAMTLMYTNAGHNDIFILRDNNNLTRLCSESCVIGKFQNEEYKTEIIKLKAGDKIILYTDGFPEARNDKKEFLGEDRFIEILFKYQNLSAKEIVENVVREVNIFKNGTPPDDDMTLLIIEITERAKEIIIDFGLAVKGRDELKEIEVKSIAKKFEEMNNRFEMAKKYYENGDIDNSYKILEELHGLYHRKDDNFKVAKLFGYVLKAKNNILRALEVWTYALSLYPEDEEINGEVKKLKVYLESQSEKKEK